MPYNIRIDVQLEDEFLKDVMTTMIESDGYCFDYWADGDREYFGDFKVKRDDDLNVTEIHFAIDPDQCPAEGECGHVFTINVEATAKAIEALIDQHQLNDFLMDHLRRGVMEGDAGEIDAFLADCIAQQWCFGTQVYS